MLNTSGASHDSEETQVELSANAKPTLPLLDVVLKDEPASDALSKRQAEVDSVKTEEDGIKSKFRVGFR